MSCGRPHIAVACTYLDQQTYTYPEATLDTYAIV